MICDRIMRHLPTLLALSVSSPVISFTVEVPSPSVESPYATFRSEVDLWGETDSSPALARS